jgi:hypothetical protein
VLALASFSSSLFVVDTTTAATIAFDVLKRIREDDAEKKSSPKRSSTIQNRLSRYCLMRDGRCMLTGSLEIDPLVELECAHGIPMTVDQSDLKTLCQELEIDYVRRHLL